jgi:hypothetical protein
MTNATERQCPSHVEMLQHFEPTTADFFNKCRKWVDRIVRAERSWLIRSRIQALPITIGDMERSTAAAQEVPVSVRARPKTDQPMK